MWDGSLIQVHNNGIRHIRQDKLNSEWKTPGKRIVQIAAINSRQVAVALSGGEITYFEIDAAGLLVEMGVIDLGEHLLECVAFHLLFYVDFLLKFLRKLSNPLSFRQSVCNLVDFFLSSFNFQAKR